MLLNVFALVESVVIFLPFLFRDDLINYNFKSTINNIKVVAVVVFQVGVYDVKLIIS